MAFPLDITPEHPVGADFIAGIHTTFSQDVLAMLDTYKSWDHAISGEHEVTSGTSVTVPIPGVLTYGTDALPAQADPAPLNLTDSTVEITTAEHGDVAVVMEQVMLQKDFNAVAQIGRQMLHAAGRKIEGLKGAVAVAGSNVSLVNNKATAQDLEAADQLGLRDLGRAVAKLRNREVLPFGNGMYRCFMNSAAIQDLLEEPGLTGIKGVLAPTDSVPFEKGWVARIAGCDIFRADQETLETLGAGDDGGGDEDADLIKTLIVGQDYMHRGTQMSFRAKFNVPAGDLMERVYKFFWKYYFGTKRMREAAGQRILSRSPSAPNP